MVAASTEPKDLLLIYPQLLCPFINAPSSNSIAPLRASAFCEGHTADARQLGLPQALHLKELMESCFVSFWKARMPSSLSENTWTAEWDGCNSLPEMQVTRYPGRTGIQVSFPVRAEVVQWLVLSVNLTGLESPRKQACGHSCERWLS